MDQTTPGIITCKAAVAWEKGAPLMVEEIQVDPPKSSEVRIKMLFSSLCHTDILIKDGLIVVSISIHSSIIDWDRRGSSENSVSFEKVIESVGENVRDLKEGDIVMTIYLGECKECFNCKSRKSNLCLKYPVQMSGLMLDGTSRISIKGQPLYHLLSCGTWSEYCVTEANYAVKINLNVHLPHASFLSCGFSTGFGAPLKTVNVEKGSSIAVFGLGAVGLGVISGARGQGATKIIGIDINDFKQEKGEAFGMTDFINPNKSDKTIPELVKDLTGGEGVDYAFECTGKSHLVNEAADATKVGAGTVVVLGAGPQKWEISVASVLYAGRTIKGSIFGGVRAKSDFPSMIDKCLNTKEIKLEELQTHEVSLDEINKAFELSKEPDCVKVLIKF